MLRYPFRAFNSAAELVDAPAAVSRWYTAHFIPKSFSTKRQALFVDDAAFLAVMEAWNAVGNGWQYIRRFHPLDDDHFLLPLYEALTFEWTSIADLPGDPNSGVRCGQYETLEWDGFADRRSEQVFDASGRPAGCRIYFRKRLRLREGAAVVDLMALPPSRQILESHRAAHHPPGHPVYMRLTVGGGTDVGPLYASERAPR